MNEDVSKNQPLSRKRGYHWYIVGAVCIGAFMAALDASIINVSMPTLSRSFSVSMNIIEWVSIAYLLTLTSLLTLLGSLSDRLGRKLFYTIGFAVFGLGSGLCGVAPTISFLIVSRVLQALGAAMLQANSVAIITASVPENSRGKAIGIQGSAQAIGLSIGPTVGGILLANYGWRLIFYVNLPIALVGTIIAAFILPKDKPNPHSSRFDYLGAILFTPALILLVLIFKDGYIVGWLSTTIICEFMGVILFLFLFVLREKRCQNPMMDLNLLKIKSFSGGNISGMLSYSLMFGVIFLMPFYLEWVMQLPTYYTGLILTVVSIAMFIMSPLSGALDDRIGPKVLTASGMILASSGAMVLVFLSSKTAIYIDILGLILVGAGMGIFTPPNNSSVMGSAPPEHIGVAGGILNMSRSLGMSMGVAIAGTLYDSKFNSFHLVHHTTLSAQILSFHVGFEGMMALGIAAALICLFICNDSRLDKISTSEYISFH
ncbi:drug resistance transporter, EmrB/QacA subfamily [Desulfosporosinus acidiphilus SJ4]|uniref:Drug resistance transporter, EmrB/QacA subfamily n=1 Tax=Desulfosporosinus acidiphilus (strain DSM 22704 / JCM 16185 / SJ4) TaxID=646529 RepID=I4D710_DESAJ|nr:MFS transporter [Desulfosporosinus acidiphilus]AFM41584.1 drug resistance transporter, EmrB/QacA subfamily [Desulfosporosinus acidiphilus SJ4]